MKLKLLSLGLVASVIALSSSSAFAFGFGCPCWKSWELQLLIPNKSPEASYDCRFRGDRAPEPDRFRNDAVFDFRDYENLVNIAADLTFDKDSSFEGRCRFRYQSAYKSIDRDEDIYTARQAAQCKDALYDACKKASKLTR